jgi:hypothetical protein
MLLIECLPLATSRFVAAPTGSMRWPRCTERFKIAPIVTAHIPAVPLPLIERSTVGTEDLQMSVSSKPGNFAGPFFGRAVGDSGRRGITRDKGPSNGVETDCVSQNRLAHCRYCAYWAVDLGVGDGCRYWPPAPASEMYCTTCFSGSIL